MYFPHNSQVPQQEYMSFFCLLIPARFLAFFFLLHHELRPRRNLNFWTLHAFTNLKCKTCFSVPKLPWITLFAHIWSKKQEFYMVTTHLHYGLYLADILNNHSFLSCSSCAFSWTLSTIWDLEAKFFWTFTWALFIFHFGPRSTILSLELLHGHGKHGPVYILHHVWHPVSKKCHEADAEVRVEDLPSPHRSAPDDG